MELVDIEAMGSQSMTGEQHVGSRNSMKTPQGREDTVRVGIETKTRNLQERRPAQRSESNTRKAQWQVSFETNGSQLTVLETKGANLRARTRKKMRKNKKQ